MKKQQTPPDQINLITALSNNEDALAELYVLYSHMFPAYKEFYSHLVMDERSHAEWINDFLTEVENHRLYVVEGRFHIENIVNFTTYINTLIEKAVRGDTTQIESLSYAYSIESALIESKCFDVYATDEPRMKMLLEDLRKATEVHERIVKEAWDKEKSGI